LATRTHGCAPWASLFHLPGSVPSTLFAACRNVLLSTNLFAGRDDFFAPKSEGRNRIAQCASTGSLRTIRVSPGTGRKDSGSRASCAPFRGWLIGHQDPRLCAVGYCLSPSGLCAKYPVCGLPQRTTIHEFVRRPRRFFRAQVRRTQQNSPVRKHWELTHKTG